MLKATVNNINHTLNIHNLYGHCVSPIVKTIETVSKNLHKGLASSSNSRWTALNTTLHQHVLGFKKELQGVKDDPLRIDSPTFVSSNTCSCVAKLSKT